MEYFRRLVLIGALLFVVLGLCDDRKGSPVTQGRDLQKIELATLSDGLVPEVLNDPPLPVASQKICKPSELAGDPALRMEHYKNSISTHLLSTLHSAYLYNRPVLFLRTGLIMHLADPGEDPLQG